MKFRTANNTPANNPLLITSNISPAPKISVIVVTTDPNVSAMAEPIFFITFQRPWKNPKKLSKIEEEDAASAKELPISFTLDTNSFILFIAVVIKPVILSTTFPNIFPSTTESLIFVKKSPNELVASKILLPMPVKLPIIVKAPFAIALKASTTISRTAKSPLNVFLILPAVSSLTLSVSVNSLKFSVNL